MTLNDDSCTGNTAVSCNADGDVEFGKCWCKVNGCKPSPYAKMRVGGKGLDGAWSMLLW
jgi:hypothetical protein